MTRWQGTTKQIGFLPTAAPTAREALGRLNEIANAVVCFENDQMGDMVGPHAGIHQAFSRADTTISQSIRSIVNLVQRPGLIRIGFDDLVAAFSVCAFAPASVRAKPISEPASLL